MLTQPTPAALVTTVIAALFVTAISPTLHAQQPAPPDSTKPKPAAPPADAAPTGDPKTGVLKPPDVDPKMAKAVPDVDPAMDNPPPGTTKVPSDAPPAEAKPR